MRHTEIITTHLLPHVTSTERTVAAEVVVEVAAEVVVEAAELWGGFSEKLRSPQEGQIQILIMTLFPQLLQ